MDIEQLVCPHLRNLERYSAVSFEQPVEQGIFLNANENPYETVPCEGISLSRYPDPLHRVLRKKLSDFLQIQESSLLIGNGSDEIIDLLIRLFCRPGEDSIVVFPPTFGMYSAYASFSNIRVIEIPLSSSFELDREGFERMIADEVSETLKLCFVCSPNNPSGNSFSDSSIEEIAHRFPGVVVIDEAYLEFSKRQGAKRFLSRYQNVAIVRTFSKAFGLAGARVGYLIASPQIVRFLNNLKHPYNVSSFSQSAALQALNSWSTVQAHIEQIVCERDQLRAFLLRSPLVETVYPSDANFLLVRFYNAQGVYSALRGEGIVVRDRSREQRCAGCLRISVGTPEQNQKLRAVFTRLSECYPLDSFTGGINR